MIQRLYLLIKEIFSNGAISAIVFFSVACSAVIVGAFDIAGEGINRYIRDRFAGSVPPNTIKVSPPPSRESFLFQTAGSATGISERRLARIRGMKGVVSVEPVLPVEVPMQAGIYLLGFGYRIDLMALGVPYSLIKEGLKEGRYRRLWRNARPGGELPVIVPVQALEAYNDGMAGPNGLPRISARMATGIKFRLVFGRSSLRSLDRPAEESAVIAGFTERPNLIALLVPINVAREYNRRFVEGYRTKYLHLYVKAAGHESLIAVRRGIAGMGLVAETGVELSQNILRLQRNVSLTVRAMELLITVLSLIAVVFSTVIATVNRVDYYRIVRIVGGSRLFITVTILVKYAVIGLAGSCAAIAVLRWASGTLASTLQFPGIIPAFSVTEDLSDFLLRYGVLLPVLSTVPSLARLYTKGLGGD